MLFLFLLHGAYVAAQSPSVSCSTTINPSYPTPSVAAGWQARIIRNGLRDPRGMVFDSAGHLLVVEQGRGITALTLNDAPGTCVGVSDATSVIDDAGLNHGIQLSADGNTLYASSAETVSSWAYNASSRKTTGNARELVTGMGTRGHSTRTLLLSQKAEGLLLVSWGSQSNLDVAAQNVESGVSQIRAFNISNATSAYDYKSSGLRLGWGLRNSVGVAEHPITGGIYSVENSVDNLEREGRDIHQNNPGEEMNFHGYLNGTRNDQQGQNYGYPSCFATWNVNDIPENSNLRVGSQFAIGVQNATLNDTVCQGQRIAPRLTFPAHTAPLDIKFNNEGSAAWITFHGSWNRDSPIGYRLSVVEFSNGEPVAKSDSSNSTIDIMVNPDESKCPDNCFRPVGLAWDRQGRLYMSSDSTGEIYVIARSDGTPAASATPSSGVSPTRTGAAAQATSGTGGAAHSADPMTWTGSLMALFVTIFFA